jgi:UPF0755 protein
MTPDSFSSLSRQPRFRGDTQAFLRPLLLLAASLLVWGVYVFEGGLSAPVTLTIRAGDTGHSIGALLYEKGVLHHPALLRFLAKVSRNELRDIQPGAYLFAGSMSLRSVQDSLSRLPIPVTVTVPEGSTAAQVAAYLESDGIVSASEFARAVADLEYPGFSRPPAGWEGFLFPDTYEFPEGLGADEIARRMVARFFENLPPNWREIAAEYRRSLTDIVTVASLVQREALLDYEMPLIAGVIYNRLKRRMPLQIDATVAYALNKWGRRISYEDLKVDHPYNTYTRFGLPPGPIGNPGRPAIIAALVPAKTEYLFFVADGTGGHRFSRTYSEHRLNVELERRRRELEAAPDEPPASSETSLPNHPASRS